MSQAGETQTASAAADGKKRASVKKDSATRKAEAMSAAVAARKQQSERDKAFRLAEGQQPSEASFTHVREVHQYFAELRSKNFDFFLILLGGCAAGYVTQDEPNIKFASTVAAGIISLIFWGLDLRTRQMIGDAREELERLEPYFDVYLHRRDSWVTPTRSRKISHKTLYTVVFGLALLTSVWAGYYKLPFGQAAEKAKAAVVKTPDDAQQSAPAAPKSEGASQNTNATTQKSDPVPLKKP